MRDKARYVIKLARADDVPVAADQIERHNEQPHDNHTGRRVARRDFALEQPVYGNRTDSNPYRKYCKEQAGNFLVCTQYILGQRRELNE